MNKLLFFLLSLFSVNTFAQNIDTLYYYQTNGINCSTTYAFGTVSSFYRNQNDSLRELFSVKEIQEFKNILSRARKKRHFQKKMGVCLFLVAVNEGFTKTYFAVRSIKGIPYSIIDFSNKKEYKIKNSDDIAWISNFISSSNQKNR